MDKARRPHVIRTWAVERTRFLHPQQRNPTMSRRNFDRKAPRFRPPNASVSGGSEIMVPQFLKIGDVIRLQPMKYGFSTGQEHLK